MVFFVNRWRFYLRIDLSPPSNGYMSLANQRPRTDTPFWTEDKTRSRVVFYIDKTTVTQALARQRSSKSWSLLHIFELEGLWASKEENR